MKIISDYLKKTRHYMGKTDGAPAMLRSHLGLVTLVKETNRLVFITHYVNHRQALASKTLSEELAHTL